MYVSPEVQNLSSLRCTLHMYERTIPIKAVVRINLNSSLRVRFPFFCWLEALKLVVSAFIIAYL